jgi:hypothetical protein
VSSRGVPVPRYDAIYDDYDKRPEYNYFGIEKPLAAEVVHLAKRFDKEKQDLLDLVQMQQRLITRLTPESCRCTRYDVCTFCRQVSKVSERKAVYCFDDEMAPTRVHRGRMREPLDHYTMHARDRLEELLRHR